MAATPRPAQVATALSTIWLSESQHHDPGATGARPSARRRRCIDPKTLMQWLRAQGVAEEQIAELLGEAYEAPGNEGTEGDGGALAEGEDQGEAPDEQAGEGARWPGRPPTRCG